MSPHGVDLLEVMRTHPTLTGGSSVGGQAGGVQLRCVGLNVARVGPIPAKIAQNVACIYLSNNVLSSVQGIEQFHRLEVLSLTNNTIHYMEGLESLSKLKSLRMLALHGNPIAYLPFYVEYILHLCPSLQTLDGTSISNAFRTEAPFHYTQIQSCLRKAFRRELRNLLLRNLSFKINCKIELNKAMSWRMRCRGGVAPLRDADSVDRMLSILVEHGNSLLAGIDQHHISQLVQRKLLRICSRARNSAGTEIDSRAKLWEDAFLRLYKALDEEWMTICKSCTSCLAFDSQRADARILDVGRELESVLSIDNGFRQASRCSEPNSSGASAPPLPAPPVPRDAFPNELTVRPSHAKGKSSPGAVARHPGKPDGPPLLASQLLPPKQVEQEHIVEVRSQPKAPLSDPRRNAAASRAASSARTEVSQPVDDVLPLVSLQDIEPAGSRGLQFEDGREEFEAFDKATAPLGRLLKASTHENPSAGKPMEEISESAFSDALAMQKMSEMRSFIQVASQKLLSVQHFELQQYQRFSKLIHATLDGDTVDLTEIHSRAQRIVSKLSDKLALNAHKLGLFCDAYAQVQSQNRQLLATFDSRVHSLQTNTSKAQEAAQLIADELHEVSIQIETEEGRQLVAKEHIQLVGDNIHRLLSLLNKFPAFYLQSKRAARSSSQRSSGLLDAASTRLSIEFALSNKGLKQRAFRQLRKAALARLVEARERGANLVWWPQLRDFLSSARVARLLRCWIRWRQFHHRHRRAMDAYSKWRGRMLRRALRRLQREAHYGRIARSTEKAVDYCYSYWRWRRFRNGCLAMRRKRLWDARMASYGKVFLLLKSFRRLSREHKGEKEEDRRRQRAVLLLRKKMVWTKMRQHWQSRAGRYGSIAQSIQARASRVVLQRLLKHWTQALLQRMFLCHSQYLLIRFRLFLRRARSARKRTLRRLSSRQQVEKAVLRRYLSRWIRDRARAKRKSIVLYSGRLKRWLRHRRLLYCWRKIRLVLRRARRLRVSMQSASQLWRKQSMSSALRRWRSFSRSRRRQALPAALPCVTTIAATEPSAPATKEAFSRSLKLESIASIFRRNDSSTAPAAASVESAWRRKLLRRTFHQMLAVLGRRQACRVGETLHRIAEAKPDSDLERKSTLELKELRDLHSSLGAQINSIELLLADQKDSGERLMAIEADQTASLGSLRATAEGLGRALEEYRAACAASHLRIEAFQTRPDPVEQEEPIRAAPAIPLPAPDPCEPKRRAVSITQQHIRESQELISRRRAELRDLQSQRDVLHRQRNVAFENMRSYQTMFARVYSTLADEMRAAECQLDQLHERMLQANGFKRFCAAQEQLLRSLHGRLRGLPDS